MKTGDLHLHCLDRYDSQNNPDKVVKRLAELGAKGFALTQHGVMSAVDQMRAAAEKYKLKFIPGIETYFQDPGDIQKRHLILLAMDITGYHALCQAVTKANDKDGYAVMNTDILRKFFGPGAAGHGHVIATSACIQGVIAMHLRRNEEVEKEIAKISRKLDKLSSDNGEYQTACNRLDTLVQTIKVEKRKQTEEEKAELAELRKKKKAWETHEERRKELQTAVDQLKKQIVSEAERTQAAKKETENFRELFGHDGNGEPCFYMEVQNHGIDIESMVYPEEARIARECGVPIVATNDVHIVDKSEEELLRRRILKALRFQEWKEDNPGDEELYIKTDEEMMEWLNMILPPDVVAEAMQNIEVIINRCNVEFAKESHYPKFPSRNNQTANEMLREEIRKGIQWRFPEGMDKQHIDMLNHELPVIESMGYADYHLIVKDFLEYGRLLGQVPDDKIAEAPLTIEELKKWLKENNHTVGFSIGPGRGSAVGSLVCYLLGITSLDPIPYGLLFERFLNPERVSMPDIDSDLSFMVRGKVIEYVTAKYGKDAVCGIMTMNAQAPRGAIRIAAKYYCQSVNGNEKLYLGLADKMAKKVPMDPGTKFSSVINEESGETVLKMLLQEFTKKDEQEILRWATILEGAFTTYGAHAAGIIISDNDDVSEYVPLRWNEKLQEWTTQCDMVQAEEIHGLLKMDFLGLRTLDIITDTMRMILENHNEVIDPLKINLNDRDVYREIFSKGKTNSVFQFESSGMKAMLKRFRPESFEDLIILVSMFRPGPLQYLDGVIEVKNGGEPTYLCDELKPILGRTYGAIVYQEQVMEIFQKLAGYTLGGADLVRRFMSKKKADKLAHERTSFIYGDPERKIPGCVANGISEDAAKELFEQMTAFAAYAFNKSHAAAYAYNAYITGWLKYHYPAEFLAAAMSWADSKKIPGLMHEAKLFGVPVTVPDVNTSAGSFTVKDGTIYFGMRAVKSVGKAGDEILEERERNGKFVSIRNFIERVSPKKNAFENLCKAGAFDCFSKNRRAVLFIYDDMKTALDKVDKKKELVKKDKENLTEDNSEKNQKKLAKDEEALSEAERALEEIVLPVGIAESLQDKMAEEKEYLGAYVTAHPMDEYPEPETVGAVPIGDFREDNTGRPSKSLVRVIGVVTDVDVKSRKKDGKPMAFVTIEDLTGSMQVNFFVAEYANYNSYLKDGLVLLIEGIVSLEGNGTTNEDGEEELSPVMFPNDVKPMNKREKICYLTVSSYAGFHIREEADFRAKYENPKGRELFIVDRTLNLIRKATYRVNENTNYSGIEWR